MYKSETFTYIIRIKNTNNYKIGQSRDPVNRIKQLQTACPEPLELIAYVKSDRWLEKRLHRMFFMSKRKGEWFSLSYSKSSLLISYLTERYGDNLTLITPLCSTDLCFSTNCHSTLCPATTYYSKNLCLNN